jgi:hypothetical protein
MGRFRQPVRDERWTDPQGEEWQVEKVGRVQKTRAPAFTAFVTFRNVSGESQKVYWPPERWTQGEGDPLKGHRARISQTVRSGARAFILPAKDAESNLIACPVKKGELYHLVCGQVLIERVQRRLVKSKDPEWHVDFIRLVTDKDYFLRRTVPAADPDVIVKPPTADDIRRATIDGNYLSGSPDKDGDPLPVVPLDWVDRGREEREARRLTDRRSLQAEEETRRQMKAIKAQMTSVCVGMVRQGLDPAPILERFVDQLKEAQQEFDRAA